MPSHSALNGEITPTDSPLPRPKRSRRRAKSDRGLPPDQELRSLATDYLKRQQKHWPELTKHGLVPDPTEDVIAEMVEDFKARHRGGAVSLQSLQPFFKYCETFGGNYNRFSCDNSSSSSINDQMTNALDKAKSENLFIPWVFIFADYSVSGLDSSRQGYQSYKNVVRGHKSLATTYVDDFTRASRDEIEWWKLAWFHKKLKKGMIGASDGFDLDSTDWDVKITLAALVSRLFIRSLQQKVRRGMQGGARRGTVLGKLPLGFTRQVARDDNGQVMLRANGLPKHVPCVDPQTAPYRKKMFDMFVIDDLSPGRIRKFFNANNVDGWNGWTNTGVRNLIASKTAIGVFTHNKTRREFDFEKETWVTVKNPESEWQTYTKDDLRIVSPEIFEKARLKLLASRENSPLTGKRPSRNELSATTLFSGTLYCDACGRELVLNRSAGPHKCFHCPSGHKGVHGCELTTSKSVRIIETCMLDFVRNHLLADDAAKHVVPLANKYLAELARIPKIKVSPIKSEIKGLVSKIDDLIERIESKNDEVLRESYDRRIAKLQNRVNDLRESLRNAESQNAAPPRPLRLEDVKSYLRDLRATLNDGSIPAAAAAIRRLTGSIRIRQEVVPGKRGARWTAVFSPNLLRFLAEHSRAKDYPDRITLEFLSKRNWIPPATGEITLELGPKSHFLAKQAADRYSDGQPKEEIASALRISQRDVAEFIDRLSKGEAPRWAPRRRLKKRKPRKVFLIPSQRPLKVNWMRKP